MDQVERNVIVLIDSDETSHRRRHSRHVRKTCSVEVGRPGCCCGLFRRPRDPDQSCWLLCAEELVRQRWVTGDGFNSSLNLIDAPVTRKNNALALTRCHKVKLFFGKYLIPR